jgi:hypothetical protein
MLTIDTFNNYGGIIGIFGIALTTFYFIKNRKIKKISFHFKSFMLIDDLTTKLEGFEAKYDGQDLPRLTASRLLFWNSGNATINSSEIAKKDPIRFNLPSSCKFLKSEIKISSSNSNNLALFTRGDNNNILYVTFDYLSPKEGCVIFLLHTCSDDLILEPLGTIIGGEAINNFNRTFFNKNILTVGTPLFFCVLLFILNYFYPLRSWPMPSFLWFLFSMMIITIAGFFLDPFFQRPKISRNLTKYLNNLLDKF